ncbi:hypothetical protein GGX14DRAFT_374695 [Mycena pura]|uniref:RNase H type-1 domain-containing protein n=1 Tax=Mycena pura TaxID=153505 RepID=A0AAD6Y3S5_9AGAR|nr:hypothetical protein GGX14DRAFT_374695 [Mycena pura]
MPPNKITSLSQGLRAFTNRTGEPKERPVLPARRRTRNASRARNAVIYVAGVIHTPPGKKPTAAAAFQTGEDEQAQMGNCIPAVNDQSQYVAELFAALAAIRSVEGTTTLILYSAQPYVREAMNKKLQSWEHGGWVGVQNRDVLQCLAAELKARKAPTYFKVAEAGTAARTACKRAARLAKKTARRRVDVRWDLTLPPHTALPGLSLQDNRQKAFYRAIREEKTKELAPRASTEQKLATIKAAVSEAFERHVSSADIWNSLSVKDFLPRPAQFLWKSVHNALKIGSFWSHIPDCEDRAVCGECGELEDLEHILVKCVSPGQELIWNAAKTLWLEREPEWPAVSLGTILGCGLAEFRDDRGKINQGARRLYRILMSESAYLIWRVRNERVIDREGRPVSVEEIENRFKFVINQRLQMDKILASRPQKGKRPALAPKLVLETWSGIIDNARNLPTDWLHEPRVLVGSRTFPSRTPYRLDNSQGIG